MPTLVCDVCGGKLLVDEGGKTATCQYCGIQHSIERLREKVQEIQGRVSIEGVVNVSGIASLDALFVRAQEFFDTKEYDKAEEYCNRVLDLDPQHTEAKKLYGKIHYVPAVGDLRFGRCVRIDQFFAFVEIAPEKDGIVHISKLDICRAERVEDVLNVGDMTWVKVIDIDQMGRIVLSRKDAIKERMEAGLPIDRE